MQAWDEFKPFKKENKHTKARDAARASAASSDSADMDGSSSAPQDSGCVRLLFSGLPGAPASLLRKGCSLCKLMLI